MNHVQVFKDASNDLLQSALDYAARGLAVLPLHGVREDGQCTCARQECGSIAKHPRTAHGLKDATKDSNQIRLWWNQWPDANLGIVTGPLSGIVVLDVDPRHGGTASLAELESVYGPLPTTVTALTGGNGKHIIFKCGGGPIKNRAGILPGLDIRGDGGYIVASPSKHVSGNRYEWAPGLALGEIPAATIPAWLLSSIQAPSDRGLALPTTTHDGSIPSGTRNETLFRLACSMRSKGMGSDAVYAAMEAENRAKCQPPMNQDELISIVESAMRYDANSPLLTLPMTDTGNAERIVHLFGDDLRFVHAWKEWLVWDGCRWRKDQDGYVQRRAIQMLRQMRNEAGAIKDEDLRDILVKHSLRSESVSKLKAMLEVAQSHLPISVSELDSDLDLINVKNGVVDLRSGELLPHDRKHFMTKMVDVDYDPNAKCPKFDAFLQRILGGNAKMIAFIQRAVGYSLTGNTGEHCLFILHGTGANGKSTLLETLRYLLGDYAQQTPFSTFLRKPSDGIPNDLARLVGARFVSASEVAEGRHLDEAVVKQITGGDIVTARYLFREFFEFKPQFKVFLACNHVPKITGTDEGIWRRVFLTPFNVFIPPEERNKNLMDELRQELPGILAWAVRGAVEWRRNQLGVPEEVKRATEAFRAESDAVRRFMEERTRRSKGVSELILSSELYHVYRCWCSNNGETEATQIAFTKRLKELGYEVRRSNRGNCWKEVELLDAS